MRRISLRSTRTGALERNRFSRVDGLNSELVDLLERSRKRHKKSFVGFFGTFELNGIKFS